MPGSIHPSQRESNGWMEYFMLPTKAAKHSVLSACHDSTPTQVLPSDGHRSATSRGNRQQACRYRLSRSRKFVVTLLSNSVCCRSEIEISHHRLVNPVTTRHLLFLIFAQYSLEKHVHIALVTLISSRFYRKQMAGICCTN